MTRHVLRLMWNRKGRNFLLMTEIFFSFLVLLAVVTLAMHYAVFYRQPVGFDIADVWRVQVQSHHNSRTDTGKAADLVTLEQALFAVRQLPEVERAALSFTTPYESSEWTSGVTTETGQRITYRMNRASDDYAEVFRIPLARGRWFSRQDAGANWTPVVINQRLATEVFGDADPIGQLLPEEKRPAGAPDDIWFRKRVVGVVQEFRQFGEFSAPFNQLFARFHFDDPKREFVGTLSLRVRPGTQAVFEERLLRTLEGTAKDWSFGIARVEQQRESMLRTYVAPLLVVGILAGFLLFMVALGLTGVLWQNVTQRIREMGLRRAKGATRTGIQRQIVGEIAAMTTLAIGVAVLLAVQVPLLPLPTAMSVPVYLASIALSVVAIYLLTMLCGWYPSRLAARVPPAEALRYE